MTAALPCVCTHLKPRHAGETYACRDCDCKRFEMDLQATPLERDLEELEASDPAVGAAAARLDETTAAILGKAYLKCPCGPFRPGDPTDAHSVVHTAWLHRLEYRVPEGESTSARLRRVEQERDNLQVARLAPRERCDQARDELARVERERDQANDLTDKIAAELRLVTRERDALARRLAVRFERIQELVRERNLAAAELASARTELEQLRSRLLDTNPEGAPKP